MSETNYDYSEAIKKNLFFRAVIENDVDLAKEAYMLRESGQDIPLEIEKRSVLHEAAFRGHLEVLVFFRIIPGIERYLFEQDESRMTPVLLAISTENVKVFEFLWNWIVEMNEIDRFLSIRDRYGWSLLGWAINSGSIEMVDCILSLRLPGVDIKDTRPPPLIACLSKGKIPLIRHLIDLGADPNIYFGHYQSPLIASICRGLLEVTKCLIEYGKADIHQTDPRGNTLHRIAEKSEQYEIASYLRSLQLQDTTHNQELIGNEVTQSQFEVEWIRPRLTGCILSPRSSPSVLIVDNCLYITSGYGYPDGTVNPAPDAHQNQTWNDLPSSLYCIPLPMHHQPILPKDMKIEDLTQNYGKKQVWSRARKSDLIGIDSTTNLIASYLPNEVKSPAVVLGALPFDYTLDYYYFEVSIISLGLYGYITVGLSLDDQIYNRHLGWAQHSYGFHGDLGSVFHDSSSGARFNSRFYAGDVIGVGLDVKRKEVFFTANGKYLGVAFQGFEFETSCYPAISLQSPGEVVKANFGREPFAFDFYAPTLKISALTGTTTPYSGLCFLVQVPSSLTSTKIGMIRPKRAEMLLLKEDSKENEAKNETKNEAKQASKHSSQHTLNTHGSYRWESIVLKPSHDVDKNINGNPWDYVPTQSHQLYWKIQTKNHIHFITQYYIHLRSNIIMILISLNLENMSYTSVELGVFEPTIKDPLIRAEIFFNEQIIATWFYNESKVYVMDIASLLNAIEMNTEIKVPEWRQLVNNSGNHPVSSKLQITTLNHKNALLFGGFEESSAQHVVDILCLDQPSRAQWFRPRTHGTVPRARFFTGHAISHGIVGFAERGNNKSTMYVVGGWNGFTSVNDIDVAEITWKSSKSDELSFKSLYDIEIKCSDDTKVMAPKIVLYSRSSFFRSLLTNDPKMTNYDLCQAFPTIKISETHFNMLLTYYETDTTQAVGDVAVFCQLVEMISPEHLKHISEVLFSQRITVQSTLASDFARVLKTRSKDGNIMLGDVLLKPTDVDRPPVCVHAYILAKNSHVFRAMLLGNYQESQLKDGFRIIQTDIDYELLELLVEGIYSGKVDFSADNQERIIDLFEASHSYHISILSNYLEEIIASNIDDDNINMIETLAQDHCSTTLLAACKEFRKMSIATS